MKKITMEIERGESQKMVLRWCEKRIAGKQERNRKGKWKEEGRNKVDTREARKQSEERVGA